MQLYELCILSIEGDDSCWSTAGAYGRWWSGTELDKAGDRVAPRTWHSAAPAVMIAWCSESQFQEHVASSHLRAWRLFAIHEPLLVQGATQHVCCHSLTSVIRPFLRSRGLLSSFGLSETSERFCDGCADTIWVMGDPDTRYSPRWPPPGLTSASTRTGRLPSIDIVAH